MGNINLRTEGSREDSPFALESSIIERHRVVSREFLGFSLFKVLTALPLDTLRGPTKAHMDTFTKESQNGENGSSTEYTAEMEHHY